MTLFSETKNSNFLRFPPFRWNRSILLPIFSLPIGRQSKSSRAITTASPATLCNWNTLAGCRICGVRMSGLTETDSHSRECRFAVFRGPPDEVPTGITQGGASFGDLEFGSLCRAGRGPRLALSGHVHDPESWHAHIGRTWSLNPGCAEGKNVPNHIVLDLERGVGFLQRSTDNCRVIRCTAEHF